MKIPLNRLSIIFCCLICFNAFAQPGHNPDPDPDLPCNFEIDVIYGESGHSLVGEQEYYGICSVYSEESAIEYEVLHLPTGYTIQNYTPGSPCIEVWGAAVETGVQSIIIAAATPEGCRDTLTITHNYQCMTVERIAPEASEVAHGAVTQYYNQKFFIEYTTFPLGLPLHFNITSGSLPPGLVLQDSGYYDTYLRGIPTTPGTYTFTLRAYLGNDCTAAEQEYTVVIDENPVCENFGIQVVYAEHTYGWVGTPEYYQICGGPDPVQFTPVNILPGYTITMDGESCIELAGSVNEPGTYSMKIAGQTSAGCKDTVIISNTWTCVNPDFIPYEFPSFNVGEYINEGLTSDTYESLRAPVIYTVAAGTLPPGLSLQPGDGTSEYDGYLTGTPTTPGIYTFTIHAVLGNNCEGSTHTYTVQVYNNDCTNFTLQHTPGSTTNYVGVTHTEIICPPAGIDSVMYTVSHDMWDFRHQTDENNCLRVTGRAHTPGTFTFFVEARTPQGCTDTLSYSITYQCPTASSITPQASQFPTSIEGEYFHQVLTAVFNVPVATVHYSVIGSLPYGFTLTDTADTQAVLKGVAGAQGDYTFTIRAEVGSCTAIDQVYTMRVLGGYAPKPLVITPLCADSIEVRNWVIYNPHDVTSILVDWELLYAPSYRGTQLAPPGYTTFQTPNIMNPNTIRISWQDGITGTKTLVRGASSELCNPPACVIGASIVSYHQGFQKNGQAVPMQFSDPLQALGEPDASDSPSDPPRHFSLGYNGFIVLELSSNLFDEPGNDLIIHEMSFGDPSFSSHPERAEVFVSQNGTQWISLGLTGSAQNCNAPLDKAFDLAGKITWCRYVKVVDKTDRHARVLTPITCEPTNIFAFDGFTNGFDVDAITCGSYTSPLASARIASEETAASRTNEHVLYPNPVNDWVTIDLSQERDFVLPENKQMQVDIRDTSGRSVYTQLHTLDPDLKTKCNLIDFQSGLFVLHVRTPQGGRFYKLIKQ